MNVILMRIPSNRNMESYLVISRNHTRFPVVGLDGIQLRCWRRGPHRNPQTIQTVAKAKVYFPQNHSEALLSRTRVTQPIEYEEVELVPTWSPHPCVLVSWCRNVLFRLLKEKCGHEHSHEILTLQSIFLRSMLRKWWLRTFESRQQTSDLT